MTGVEVFRGVLPLYLVDAVRRRLNADVLEHGLPADWLTAWLDEANHWPHLRDCPQIAALQAALPDWTYSGDPCEPQILASYPAAGAHELTFHVDDPPPWADGRRYSVIVGVPLTRHDEHRGTFAYLYDGSVQIPTLDPGDVFVFEPQVQHTGTPNRSADVRLAVYFRYLEPKGTTP